MYRVKRHPHNKGFTLIEVMVSLVVMSIGMLGLASIQAISIQNNQTAYMRTLAMQSAYNIADLIRTGSDSDGTITSVFDAVTSTVPSAPTNCIVNDSSTSCSAADMAASDIYQWKKNLETLLPSGRGAITRSGSIYEIKIMWDEDRTGETGEGCDPTDADDLKCYQLFIQI